MHEGQMQIAVCERQRLLSARQNTEGIFFSCDGDGLVTSLGEAE